jgi:hypothetical protein
MTRALHCLVGYDRQTDRMMVRFDVPDDPMPVAKKRARAERRSRRRWSYPLTAAKTRRLTSLIGIEVASKDAEFYLEALAR